MWFKSYVNMVLSSKGTQVHVHGLGRLIVVCVITTYFRNRSIHTNGESIPNVFCNLAHDRLLVWHIWQHLKYVPIFSLGPIELYGLFLKCSRCESSWPHHKIPQSINLKTLLLAHDRNICTQSNYSVLLNVGLRVWKFGSILPQKYSFLDFIVSPSRAHKIETRTYAHIKGLLLLIVHCYTLI